MKLIILISAILLMACSSMVTTTIKRADETIEVTHQENARVEYSEADVKVVIDGKEAEDESTIDKALDAFIFGTIKETVEGDD